MRKLEPLILATGLALTSCSTIPIKKPAQAVEIQRTTSREVDLLQARSTAEEYLKQFCGQLGLECEFLMVVWCDPTHPPAPDYPDCEAMLEVLKNHPEGHQGNASLEREDIKYIFSFLVKAPQPVRFEEGLRISKIRRNALVVTGHKNQVIGFESSLEKNPPKD